MDTGALWDLIKMRKSDRRSRRIINEYDTNENPQDCRNREEKSTAFKGASAATSVFEGCHHCGIGALDPPPPARVGSSPQPWPIHDPASSLLALGVAS